MVEVGAIACIDTTGVFHLPVDAIPPRSSGSGIRTMKTSRGTPSVGRNRAISRATRAVLGDHGARCLLVSRPRHGVSCLDEFRALVGCLPMRMRGAIAGLAGLLLVVVPGSPASAAECTHSQRTSGQCPSVGALVTQGGVVVSGTAVTPGTPGSTYRGTWTPPPPKDPVLGSAQCEVKIAGLCRGTSPSKSVVEVEEPTPPTSVSDIAQFAPSEAGFLQEPAGWSLPLLPTNVYSTTGATTESESYSGGPLRFASPRWHTDGTGVMDRRA